MMKNRMLLLEHSIYPAADDGCGLYTGRKKTIAAKNHVDNVDEKIMKHASGHLPPRADDSIEDEEDGMLPELVAYFKDQVLRHRYRETTSETGFNDRRVTDKTITLAYRMLQRAVLKDSPRNNVIDMELERFSLSERVSRPTSQGRSAACRRRHSRRTSGLYAPLLLTFSLSIEMRFIIS
jgi:hypothetical protein